MGMLVMAKAFAWVPLALVNNFDHEECQRHRSDHLSSSSAIDPDCAGWWAHQYQVCILSECLVLICWSISICCETKKREHGFSVSLSFSSFQPPRSLSHTHTHSSKDEKRVVTLTPGQIRDQAQHTSVADRLREAKERCWMDNPAHLDNPDYDGYETMGTDGEYTTGMAESSADYGWVLSSRKLLVQLFFNTARNT